MKKKSAIQLEMFCLLGLISISCLCWVSQALSWEPFDELPCGPCISEYIKQTDLQAPNGECEHGWAWDSDCYAVDELGNKRKIKDCCEVGWGGTGCTGAQYECACTTCGIAGGKCEAMQERWITWCGGDGTGPCEGPSEADPNNIGPPTRTMQRKPADPQVGCGFEGGAFDVKPCGTPRQYLSCKANDNTCVDDGNWVDAKFAVLSRCKTLDH